MLDVSSGGHLLSSEAHCLDLSSPPSEGTPFHCPHYLPWLHDSFSSTSLTLWSHPCLLSLPNHYGSPWFCDNILLIWLSRSYSNVAQLTVRLRWAETTSAGFPLPGGTARGTDQTPNNSCWKNGWKEWRYVRFAAAAESLQSCPTLCDPNRRQPARLPRPWDSPGRNTGVGCHFLLQCVKVKSENEVAQSCPTHSDRMDCSLPGSSIHGIFQARGLEWGAIAFSNGRFTIA